MSLLSMFSVPVLQSVMDIHCENLVTKKNKNAKALYPWQHNYRAMWTTVVFVI